MKKLLTLVGALLCLGSMYGQSNYIRCYSEEYLKQQIEKNPDRGRKLDALNKMVDDFVSYRTNAGNSAGEKGKPGGGGGGNTPRSNTVYVPVIVNVVYRTNAENISDAQVQSQIEVLNMDFSAMNFEYLHSAQYNWSGYLSLVADFKIQFCLVDIKRRQTTSTSFSYSNDNVKRTSSGGLDPTDPTTKLNLWSCNLGGGLLGYAQFPGGSSATDGVVCLYSAFGTSAKGATADPYDEGRTVTHEVGHWFGLYHTFQGGCSKQNDGVSDTPPTREPYYGCPSSSINSACRGAGYIQTMNYMDYTDDLCMYMFTQGQLNRVDGFIASARAPYSLTACPGSRLVSQNKSEKIERSEDLLLFPTITRGRATLVITSKTKGVANVSVLNQAGSAVQTNNVSLNIGTTKYNLDISNMPAGMYIIRVNKPNGSYETGKLVKQ